MVYKYIWCVDWICLVQDRNQWLVSCEHVNETSGPIKCGLS
jgi:hypothetical protein